eukprot:TRINITY_DN33984_c0_g1_i1.p1 TRINITY_DN33984_c0_g1~~TRINITY_DN33984_c0_g1_i1.p1  ORF type:complete len:561 (+),score=183.22 TRINITY_DN33984_c0_g1_i1:79-1683(+)
MEGWTTEQVAQWCAQQGGLAPGSAERLRAHHFDGAALARADEAALVAAGFARIGERRALQRARDAAARGGATAPQPPRGAANGAGCGAGAGGRGCKGKGRPVLLQRPGAGQPPPPQQHQPDPAAAASPRHPARPPAHTAPGSDCPGGAELWAEPDWPLPPDEPGGGVAGRCDAMCPASLLDKGQRSRRFEGSGGERAVKAYERPAAGAAPDPREVRTAGALVRTCRFLASEVLAQAAPPLGSGSASSAQLYAFLANRLRAVRADFGVQGEGARGVHQIRCAELAARFHAAAPALLSACGPADYDARLNCDMLDDTLSHRLLPLYRGYSAVRQSPEAAEAALRHSGELCGLWLLHQALPPGDDWRHAPPPSSQHALSWLARELPSAASHPCVRSAGAVAARLLAEDWGGVLRAAPRLPWLQQALLYRVAPRARILHFAAVWKAVAKQEALLVAPLTRELCCVDDDDTRRLLRLWGLRLSPCGTRLLPRQEQAAGLPAPDCDAHLLHAPFGGAPPADAPDAAAGRPLWRLCAGACG